MKSWIYYLPTFIVLAVAALLLCSSKVFAYESPSFPTCINPQGTVIAHYDTGLHAIAGDQTLHVGRDTVYQVTDTTVLQCFCDEQNNGIQTNWWKIAGNTAAGISQEQVDWFLQNGWIYIPNGSDWGLDQGPYLAKNSTFNCAECVTPTPTPTPTPEVTVTPVATTTPEPGKTQSASASTSSSGSTQAVMAATSVPALAGTGSSAQIVLTFIGGLLSVSGSLLLKKTLE